MEDIFLEEIDDSKKDEYLKYHEFKDNDEKLIVMSWQDVCFVEETE